jgi:hypothetical protein
MLEALMILLAIGLFVAASVVFGADSRDNNEWIVRPRV